MDDLALFESLLNCGSVEDLHTSTAEIVKKLGFEHFLYAVRVNISLTRPYHFLFSGYPKEWRDHYEASGYASIDPTVQHCAKKVIPIIWDGHVFSAKPAQKLKSEAQDFGLTNGASFAVHGGHGEAAMLSLTTSRNSRQASQDIVATLGSAQLLTCYLHEAVQRIVLSKDTLPLRKINLTERERECILWAAEGKTGWEIANILNVSERTVTFHLQNAAQKMGVTSRQHAVSRAVSLGLIAP